MSKQNESERIEEVIMKGNRKWHGLYIGGGVEVKKIWMNLRLERNERELKHHYENWK